MKNRYIWKIIKSIAVLLVLITFLPFKSLAEELHFVSIEGLIEQRVGTIVLPKIYKKIGISVELTALPGMRAQKIVRSGLKDGEIMRIWTYGENNSTVVRVPTPYYFLETMAFIKVGSGVEINSEKDLRKYRVGKVRGVKHTDNISKNIPCGQVHDLNSTRIAMKMLLRERVDVVLTNTNDGLMVIKQNGFEGIAPISEPLAVLELYNYIHQSKVHIVPMIDAVIKEMKANGELALLIEQAEKQVIGDLISN